MEERIARNLARREPDVELPDLPEPSLAALARWAVAQGLTLHDLAVLAALWEAGRCRTKVLGLGLELPASTVSRCLDRLEAHALVRRDPQPGDRRAKLVEVTERARAMLRGF